MSEISRLHLLVVKDLAATSELQSQELEQQLSLYQIFLKLYEQHSTLLDEILQLENLYQPSLKRAKTHYLQGVMDDSAVYVITNLYENQTQTLQQPQQIWTIGRDRSSGICIRDQYLSRRHAAIQYIEHEGFYLIDFNSTNGSFVNGEHTHEPIKLKDGDRIRLGSMTFDFFLSDSSRVLPTVAMELLMQLVPRGGGTDETVGGIVGKLQKLKTEKSNKTLEISQDLSLAKNLDDYHTSLNTEQQSEILDRFFSRSTSFNPK
ncbi:FHA domain-containing protein [Nostocaceae cyanobacterium CENA357]|uniref:FHA domain-containing protein n=1 Tax=Atlanticothrix silvestris CENA357 TaxID=1725252 RepID=A0A8J7L388_9CYAN|nr:FHA domain-containing protein [Atlanticothrix silvestris]MBH8554795.1 FHA domain-containing protein [Atlanticothrix silvestris CENA357]